MATYDEIVVFETGGSSRAGAAPSAFGSRRRPPGEKTGLDPAHLDDADVLA